MSNEVKLVFAGDADKLDKTLKGVGKGAKSVEDNVGQASGGIQAKFGKLWGGIAAGAVIGGAAIGAGLMMSMNQALDKSKLDAKLAAQIGATPEMAASFGKLSGQIYADNFGASLDEVNAALKTVWQNGLVPEDAADADIKRITEKLLTVGTVVEEDASRVSLAVKQMMRTGMAKSADEAMDLIVRSTQQGINKSEDLLDTLNEYGTQFRKLGLDGPTAMGLVSQAIKAGARDSDVAADALKEFSIRAIDGSKLSMKAFKDLGLNGKDMATMIAKGGKSAQTGLDLVLDRIRNIKDPVKQAAIATGLFGTQAEDLGQALFAMDVTGASDQMGKLAGATDKAATTMGESAGAKIDAFKRRTMMGLTQMGGRMIGFFEGMASNPKVKTFLGDASKYINQHVIPTLRSLVGWFNTKVKPVLIDLVQNAIDKAKTAWRDLQQAVKDNGPELRTFVGWLKSVANFVMTKVVPAVGPAFTGALATTIMFIKFGVQNIAFFVRAVKGIGTAVAATTHWVVDRFGATMRYIRELPHRISSAFSGIGRIVSAPFRAGFNAIARAWNSTVGQLHWSVPGWVPFIGGFSVSAPSLPTFHKGGVVPGAPGQEMLAVLQSGERVTPAGVDTSMGLVIRSGGSRLDDLLVDILSKAIRVRGGNVQRVLGTASG